MSEACIFNLEDFCIVRDEYPELKKENWHCKSEGKNGKCLAKASDLVEVCEFCGKPNCYGECLDEEG